MGWRDREARRRREAREAKKDKLWTRVTAGNPQVARHLTRPEVAALVWAWSKCTNEWHTAGFLKGHKRTNEWPVGRPWLSMYAGISRATLDRMVVKGLMQMNRDHSELRFELTNKGCEWARRLHEILDENP